MRFIIETEQLVFTLYAVEAEDEDAALTAYHSGEAEEVDQSIHEEILCDVYIDDV